MHSIIRTFYNNVVKYLGLNGARAGPKACVRSCLLPRRPEAATRRMHRLPAIVRVETTSRPSKRLPGLRRYVGTPYLPQRFKTAFVTASRTASWRMAH